MAEANIIPFPKAFVRDCDQERLRRALEDLQSALGEQKRALQDWRFAMTELGVGVAGLGHALGSYQSSLGSVEARLVGLRDEARRLENWADGVLAQPASATGSGASAGR